MNIILLLSVYAKKFSFVKYKHLKYTKHFQNNLSF